MEEFLFNALLAGTFIAPACGLLGYFLVVRNQVFAGDALTHVAFTGSLAALAYGVDQLAGLFAATIAVGLALAALSTTRPLNDVAIGTTFSWLLGLGSLFLYLFTTEHSASNAQAGPNVLFGSIFGISTHAAIVSAGVSIAVIVLTLFIARPLLYASLDAVIAAMQGVPTRLLGTVFIVLVSIQIAETVQLVGALLLLGLIATPAATASRLTANPYKAMGLSVIISLAVVWLGLLLSYALPDLPPSFCIITLAFVAYVVAVTLRSKGLRSAL